MSPPGRPSSGPRDRDRDSHKDKEKEPRINHGIRTPKVRVIGADGSQLGVIDTLTACRLALDQGLDLVEVSPNTDPPVCRIMDYGKFKYAQKKKTQESKKKQVTVVLKEIKFRPKTEAHDIEFKLRHVRRFLSEGNKTKLTITFRGREMAHTEVGFQLLTKILDQLKGDAVTDAPPRLEGRSLSVIVSAAKQEKSRAKNEDQVGSQEKV